jgi:hypothetical protein
MRIRSIKPDFWTDEKMSVLPPETVLLAIGLQNCADDEGYFNANPRLIQASVFPLRDLSGKVPVMLHELSRIGFLTYVASEDGRVTGHLLHFAAMQVISHARHSELKGVFDASVKAPGKLPESSGLIPAGLEGKGREGKGEGRGLGGGGGKRKGTPPAGGGVGASASQQIEIYEAYPRKVKRPEALRAIAKAVERGTPAAELLERTRCYAAAVARWPADFRYTREGRDLVPHPASWFNAEAYADDEATWQPGLRSEKIAGGGARGGAEQEFDPNLPNAHTGGLAAAAPVNIKMTDADLPDVRTPAGRT